MSMAKGEDRSLDPENLKAAIKLHEALSAKAGIAHVCESPWYPSLEKVARILVNFFVSEKSPASATAKAFALSQLDAMPCSSKTPITASEMSALDSCVLQMVYPTLQSCFMPVYMPLVEDVVKLTEHLHTAEQVAALVAENENVFDVLYKQLERVILDVISYIDASEGGREFLSEVEVLKDSHEALKEVRDDIDEAIIDQLTAIARTILLSEGGRDKEGNAAQSEGVSEDIAPENLALKHILQLFAGVLHRLRANSDIWSDLRMTCMDRNVTTAKLQGTLFATVNYALSQAFEAMPSEDELRQRFESHSKINSSSTS